MAKYNIIIKNGTVFDGKSNSPQKIDIGITKDEIKKIGNLEKETAEKIIDAQGRYVSPGFIDLTNHSDIRWTIFTNPVLESLLRQGITTILGGNCGLSIAPLVRGIGISGVNVNWQSVSEMLAELDNRQLSLNFGTLVGFKTLEENSTDFNQMKMLLESSLKEGAFGLSTSLGLGPTRLSEDEIEELLKSLKKFGGFTKHHLEDEGKEILPALSNIIGFARKTETQTHISHFKILGKGAWPLFDSTLEMMRNARAEGIRLTFDFFPYQRTGSNLFMLLPSWLRKMGRDQIIDVLKSKESKLREETIKSLENLTLHYDKITVTSSLKEIANTGKTILEISRITDLSPEETILDLLASNNLFVSIFSEVINKFHILKLSQEDYGAIATDGIGYDASIFTTATDLPHPRSFGTFPKAFRIFVKEENLLDWQKTIYKSTGLPAAILGLKDRGTIEKGKKSDIIVFNPNELSEHSTYENPFQFSGGIEYVIVNGIIELDKNQLTGKSAGRVLKKT
ncbi:MAG: amidohydrolase family protein [Patescibacteria group bacterium]